MQHFKCSPCFAAISLTLALLFILYQTSPTACLRCVCDFRERDREWVRVCVCLCVCVCKRRSTLRKEGQLQQKSLLCVCGCVSVSARKRESVRYTHTLSLPVLFLLNILTQFRRMKARGDVCVQRRSNVFSFSQNRRQILFKSSDIPSKLIRVFSDCDKQS